MLKKDISLKEYSNFKTGGLASYFFDFSSVDELKNNLNEWKEIDIEKTPVVNPGQGINEYELLKSELTRRSQGKDNQLFTETMGKAEKLLEEHLDRIWSETQNIAGQEIDYSQFETEFVDFKKFYEIRLHNDKAKGNLVDILFEKPYFESSY